MSSKVYLATKNDLGALQTTGVGVGEVGVVTWQYTLLANHLKLDGTTVLGAEYPLLLAFAVNHALITTDADNKVLFKYDETTDVLTLPDLMGLCVQGGADVVEMHAGLPNITGDGGRVVEGLAVDYTGAFSNSVHSSTIQGGASAGIGALKFNASLSSPIYGASDTVQPPAVTLIPQIRYAADVTRGNDYTIGATGLWEDMVGHVLYDVVLRDGFIKANGASVALASTSVPRLVAFVREHTELLGDGPALYKYAEAEDTLTLPNFTARVLQGGDSVGSLEAGLPNIKGQFVARAIDSSGSVNCVVEVDENGNAFVAGQNLSATWSDIFSRGNISYPRYIKFDAQKSNDIYNDSNTTVQPPAITLIPQIKY